MLNRKINLHAVECYSFTRMKFALRFVILASLVLTALLYIITSSKYNLHIFDSHSNASQPQIYIPKNLFDGQILKKAFTFNSNNFTVNDNKFGALTNENLVIVVQIHKRIDYLRTLISSMSKVKGIEETLLVFSHDVFNEEINQLVKAIDFAKALQIFFPFSIQIWKNTFPGTSFNDCSRNLAKEDALKLNCSNANYPDTYGHYRESNITQTKHHWWWKVNFLMDHHLVTKNHNGHFLFIEEDHYLMPDFFHTWKLMKKIRKKLEEVDNVRVDLLTLGNYDNNYNAQINTDKLHLVEWFSSKHNMAFTIDRILWDKLKLCSAEFCTYDDYNWDWTLQHVIQDCFDDNLLTLLSIVPRVFHIGTCGVHHKKADCSVDKQVQALDALYSGFKDKFFPSNFSVIRRQNQKSKLVNNGGWNDPRDHELCINYELPFEQIIQTNGNFRSLKSDLSILNK